MRASFPQSIECQTAHQRSNIPQIFRPCRRLQKKPGAHRCLSAQGCSRLCHTRITRVQSFLATHCHSLVDVGIVSSSQGPQQCLYYMIHECQWLIQNVLVKRSNRPLEAVLPVGLPPPIVPASANPPFDARISICKRLDLDKSLVLGVDSPFCSTIVLSTSCFPWGF